MNCKKCGSPLTENDKFCKNCGAAVNAQEVQDSVQSQQSSQPDMMQSQPLNNQVYQQSQQNYGNNNFNGWQSGYNQTSNFQQQKPNNNVKYIVIGVVIAAALFGGLFLFYSMNKDDSNNGGPEPIVAKPSTKSYKVNFKGFTFTIPDNLVYEQKNGFLLIGDEIGSWATQIELEEGSFARLKANKNQLPSLMQQSGYVCSTATEKTLGGIEFITMEASRSGQNSLIALTKANAMYFIAVTAINQDNNIDYKLLEKIAPIVGSAESTTVMNSMSPSSELNMSAIAELAK